MGSQSDRPEERGRLVAGLLAGRDEELARVSRALHDEVGQVLTAIGLQLDVLRLDFVHKAPDLAARVTEIQELLETGVAQVRLLSCEIHPDIVERAGLQFAMDQLVGRFRKVFGGSMRWRSEAGTHLPPPSGSVLYKIAELALDNAVRHARATHIEVRLRSVAGGARLEILDDGVGFDYAAARKDAGLGLYLMEHYATQAGLSLVIQSASGKGTGVMACHAVASESQGEAGEHLVTA